jgi:light-regulated signal transduction histidine kinase (bacteriophytochrome)
MVVTAVAGAEKIQRCEDEPIHIPGAIQGFGCLLALRERDGGTVFDIRIVSEVRLATPCIITDSF